MPKFLYPVDLARNELRNVALQNLASAPSTPAVGQAYFDTTLQLPRVWTGSVWIDIGNIVFGTPGDSAVGDTATQGVSPDSARADHTHGREDFGPVSTTLDFAWDPTNGTADTVARSDHNHGSALHDDAAHNWLRLNVLQAPDADVSFGGYKLTDVASPTTDTDGVNKAYADALRAGLDVKQSVRYATTGPITLSGNQSVDGATTAAGMRVLVKDQVDATENGIYLTAAGAWARASDADAAGEFTAGLFVFVTEGAVNSDSGWVLTTNDPVTLGSTPLAFAQFSGAGQIIAGTGITKSGNTLSLTTPVDIANGGTGAATAAAARAALGVPGVYSTTIGDNSSTAITVTHSLGTRDVQVSLYSAGSPYAEVDTEVEHTDANSVLLRFSVAPATNAYRCVVIG